MLTWITVTTGGAPEDQTLPATPVSWRGTAFTFRLCPSSFFFIAVM